MSREGEMVRREQKPSAKQAAFEVLQPAFDQATSKESIVGLISAQGFELYQRGKSWGVVHLATGRRHRLKTLGLLPAFQRVLERNSAPSQSKISPVAQKSRPGTDARAADLLKNREGLAAQARELLDGYERDEEDGR